jgi:hypothetical protein
LQAPLAACQQRIDFAHNIRAIDARQGVPANLVVRRHDLGVREQFKHSRHKRRLQQRHVAPADVHNLDATSERVKPGSQRGEWPAVRFTVDGYLHFCGQIPQLLAGRGHADQVLNRNAPGQDAHDTLQQCFARSKWQRRLIATHAGALAAAKNYGTPLRIHLMV